MDKKGNKSATQTTQEYYQKQAAADLAKILSGSMEFVRPATKIPQPYYPKVKYLLAYKRQTFQEYVWALILEDLAKNGLL